MQIFGSLHFYGTRKRAETALLILFFVLTYIFVHSSADLKTLNYFFFIIELKIDRKCSCLATAILYNQHNMKLNTNEFCMFRFLAVTRSDIEPAEIQIQIEYMYLHIPKNSILCTRRI